MENKDNIPQFVKCSNSTGVWARTFARSRNTTFSALHVNPDGEVHQALPDSACLNPKVPPNMYQLSYESNHSKQFSPQKAFLQNHQKQTSLIDVVEPD